MPANRPLCPTYRTAGQLIVNIHRSFFVCAFVHRPTFVCFSWPFRGLPLLVSETDLLSRPPFQHSSNQHHSWCSQALRRRLKTHFPQGSLNLRYIPITITRLSTYQVWLRHNALTLLKLKLQDLRQLSASISCLLVIQDLEAPADLSRYSSPTASISPSLDPLPPSPLRAISHPHPPPHTAYNIQLLEQLYHLVSFTNYWHRHVIPSTLEHEHE